MIKVRILSEYSRQNTRMNWQCKQRDENSKKRKRPKHCKRNENAFDGLIGRLDTAEERK